MKTAKLVYIILLLITVIPLFGFNFRRIFIKREGEKRRVSIPKALLLVVSVVALSSFIIGLYNYTITHQEFLLIEKYTVVFLKNTNEGKVEQFQSQSAAYSLDGKGNIEQQDIKELFSDVQKNKTHSYQMGGYVRPKYYSENALFPEVELSMQNPDKTFYTFIRVDNGQGEDNRLYLILRLNETENGWRVCSIHKASDELVAYAVNKKLISGENALIWKKF